jgi:hypothetical protein
MKILRAVFILCLLISTPTAFAKYKGFISIPVAAFSSQGTGASNIANRYEGNDSGTSRTFISQLFAPVNLPHHSIVTSFSCGTNNATTNFILRRNEPEQANKDMAFLKVVGGPFISLSYRVLHTTKIASPGIDNSKFNYFIVAKHDPFTIVLPGGASTGAPFCEGSTCGNIRFCRIGYTNAGNKPTNSNAKIPNHRSSSKKIER